MTDFYTLLAAQLKYQDADNPMDTSEMMAQMVQMQMITTLNEMSTAISDLSLVDTTSYAVSMIGKEATIALVDDNGYYTGEEVTGTITSVNLGTDPTVTVNGQTYSLSQMMTIGATGATAATEAVATAGEA
jgi:flagellar basal-body rod modification protein FlgD